MSDANNSGSGMGTDSRLFRSLTKAGDFMILGVMTVIFCLPVITAGAALTAAFYSGIKLVRDEESYVHKDFWKSFKLNFVQSTVLELIHAVIGFLLILDLRASVTWGFSEGSTAGTIFVFIVIGVIAVWAATLIYTFSMQSRYQNSMFQTLKNALLVAEHHLPQTIIILIATGGLAYFTIQYFVVFFVTVPIILYVDSYIFSSIFMRLEKDMVEEIAENADAVEDAGDAVDTEDAENVGEADDAEDAENAVNAEGAEEAENAENAEDGESAKEED